jgi:hypothetical protein
MSKATSGKTPAKKTIAAKTPTSTAAYQVEAKVAIPAPFRRGIFKASKKVSKAAQVISLAFPFKAMKKGDSFLIPAATAKLANYAQRRASWYAILHSEATGFKSEFTTRLVENGVRVFRTK